MPWGEGSVDWTADNRWLVPKAGLSALLGPFHRGSQTSPSDPTVKPFLHLRLHLSPSPLRVESRVLDADLDADVSQKIGIKCANTSRTSRALGATPHFLQLVNFKPPPCLEGRGLIKLISYCNSARTVCGMVLACANMAVPACWMICVRASSDVAAA